MNKTSTLHLKIHDLASNTNEELKTTDSFFDFQNDYEDVFEVLDSLNLDVRQEVVNRILDATTKTP
jgi:hypothetical protein